MCHFKNIRSMSLKYEGMAVNERLIVSNLDSKFYDAVKAKNVGTVIEILKEVEFSDKSTINPILEQLGLALKKKK
jgi:hypothetical protein